MGYLQMPRLQLFFYNCLNLVSEKCSAVWFILFSTELKILGYFFCASLRMLTRMLKRLKRVATYATEWLASGTLNSTIPYHTRMAS